jgi:O-antigen/teichoic acid export membrane protein
VLALSDVLIVGAAAGVRAAAVYAVAQRLAQLPLKAVQPRSGLLFVTAGTLIARENRSGLREAVDEVVGFGLAMSIPAALAIGFLAGPAIEAWVGPLYRESVPVIGLLVIAAVVQAWAQPIKLAINGAGHPKLTAAIFGAEAVIHVALGLFLAGRYGALGMAEAALAGVVLMEGLLLLPLAYRWLGDSLPRRIWRAVRTLGIPALVTGVVAWAVGRSDGRLYVFTDTHGRVVGLLAVAASGVAVLIVFYVVLVVTAPAGQRQQFLTQFRSSVGRLAGRLH